MARILFVHFEQVSRECATVSLIPQSQNSAKSRAEKCLLQDSKSEFLQGTEWQLRTKVVTLYLDPVDVVVKPSHGPKLN
jgi:hypothetical protein